MDCIFYIHCADVQTILAALKSRFGASENNRSTYRFRQFACSLRRNMETDFNRLCTYPDGFLYYESIVDMEIPENHVAVTADILRVLWQNRIPAVVSCDYEQELNAYLFQQKETGAYQ